MYKPEYILYRQIAYYLRAQYPGVIFHFDPTGLNLSKTQSGMLKAIQGMRGYPDLFIAEVKMNKELFNDDGKVGYYNGLFIELKAEGTKLYKKDGSPATLHIAEQLDCLLQLKCRGYQTGFGVGFDNTKEQIDKYLK